MAHDTRILGGLMLLAGASTFQACSDDEVIPSGDAGGSGNVMDGGVTPARDAGISLPEPDASTPGTEVDAGDGNGEPDGGSVTLPPFVPRQLCVIVGASLQRYAFPTLEQDSYVELAGVRPFTQLHAVDSVHDEMFLRGLSDEGTVIDVFALDATGFDAPLRSIRLDFDDSRPLAVTFDADSDTLLLLSGDPVSQTYWISTYSRTATNEASPVRRVEFEYDPGQGSLSPTYALAVDPARERIVVATGSRFSTFPLAAAGPTEPLESTLRSASKLTISVLRDELYVEEGNTVETFALDAPLEQPAIRSLYAPGDTLIDDVNDEIWVSSSGEWSVYDIEATDVAEPLATGTLSSVRGRLPELLAVLPERDEVLAQTRDENLVHAGSILAYERDRPAANAEPLRVLAASDGRSVIRDFVGVSRSRGEVYVRDQRNGFISAYPLEATESAEPLRHFGLLGGGTAASDAAGTAYFEAEGLIFAPGALPVGTFPAFTPILVYPDTSSGLLTPDREAGRDLFRLAVADEPAELLGVKRAAYRGALPVLEAYSLAQATFGILQRAISITSPRPVPPLMWRVLQPLAVVHDSIRDEVVIAVRDCVDFVDGPPGDCHFDLKIVPRAVGTDPPIETVELPHSVVALAFDDVNGLLLVQGDNGVSFYARPQLTSAPGQAGFAGKPLLGWWQFSTQANQEGHVAIGYCD